MDKETVIVFLPAHNEEESIAEVIHKIPRAFDSRVRVKVLVIDDGSTDLTVQVAWRAGANYVTSLPSNQGLGAAVREGLRQCDQLGADIAVMIDADNEYPAWQIPELLEPIFKGEADYTMGSRFLGTIKGMRLHRRIGNYFFTFLQSILIKKWIHDGQSGMRAFSKQAIKQAEIIHDYNYAQVLTLNLARKGFRIKEVPIQYQVRTKGQSFIKFKAYMTSVFPAILKEMTRHVDRVDINRTAHKLEKQNERMKSS